MVASFTIEAIDNEFAVSTNANVNAGAGSSIFDNPPNATKDLVITTQDGDDDPRLFEVGDVYDISFGGNGGATIDNAVVVRSDTENGTNGIIVFEGTDSNGDLAQVIWTPGFDLENWYWTNYNPSAEPQFFVTDQDPAYTHEYVCFEKSVKIHTPIGLVPAGRLKAGDWVCTWGGRKQQLRWVGKRRVIGPGKAAMVRFAKGTIGNFAPIKLSLQHRVPINSPLAETHFGSSEVLVPAVSLVDGGNIRKIARPEAVFVHLLLDHHDILIAEGAPCESLLLSQHSRARLDVMDQAKINAAFGDRAQTPCRPLLTVQEARVLAPERDEMMREPALM